MFGPSIAYMKLLLVVCVFSALNRMAESQFISEDQLLHLPVGTRYRVTKSPAPIPTKESSLDESGDLAHLGGFVANDPKGISNNTFNFLMGGLAVKSIIDVGCGKGVSTNHFHRQGARVLCVEGSHKAVSQTVLPADCVVEHDFTLGPWWPDETYDAAWSVEFVEHVGRQHIANYMPIFHKSALIFISGSGFGGSHHVEVHARWWWKSRLAAQGFEYSRDLSQEVRKVAMAGRANPGSEDSQSIVFGMMVFINPAVASLPQHQHLFGGHGCYANKIDNVNGGQPCTGEDQLPAEFEALLSCQVEKKVVWNCQRNPRAVPLK